LFQVRVEPLLWVELRAVAGQVKQLNLVLALSHPRLDQLAVVNPQVVQNQKDFFARVFDQSLQKFDQLLSIKSLVNDHPTRLALVGHRGNHRKLLTGTAHGHGHRCFARWCKASAAYIGVDQSRLIAPVNLSALGPGALLDAGVLALQPSLHGSRALLVSALDGLLRCEAPAGEVLADAAYLQLDAKFLFDELAHCGPAPQAEIHLELLGAFVDDQALDGLLLEHTEHPPIASGSSTNSGAYRTPTASVKQIDSRSYCRVAQPRHRDDLHDLGALSIQPHDLLSAFVKLLQCLTSCAFFFHVSLTTRIRKSSDFIGPYL